MIGWELEAGLQSQQAATTNTQIGKRKGPHREESVSC